MELDRQKQLTTLQTEIAFLEKEIQHLHEHLAVLHRRSTQVPLYMTEQRKKIHQREIVEYEMSRASAEHAVKNKTERLHRLQAQYATILAREKYIEAPLQVPLLPVFEKKEVVAVQRIGKISFRAVKMFVFFWILCIAVLGGVWYLHRPVAPIAVAPSIPVVKPTTQVLIDYPVLVRIPKLAIQATIEKVGLTQTGDMQAPTNYTDVAWYQYGTIPGQIGSAVIAGHLDTDQSTKGVFWDLNKLQVNDSVVVQMHSGKSLHFIVRKKSEVSATTLHTATIFADTNEQDLNLITCTGLWNPTANEYVKRLIVSTQLEK